MKDKLSDTEFEQECLEQALYDAELALTEAELELVEIEDESFAENQCHIQVQLRRDAVYNAERALERFHQVNG
jgi:hypothetical protein